MKIIDISVSVDGNTPLWPKAKGPLFKKVYDIKMGLSANDTTIKMGVHTGTHIDAPLHFIKNGKSVGKLSLDVFIGPVFVVNLPKVKEITADNLEKLKIPKNTERILFRTSNSSLWRSGKKFRKNYVGLTESAAVWLAKTDVKLVGVDYISIAKFNETISVHKILLGKEIVLLEGLNLSEVKSGTYELICLPVKFSDLEAAPVRAVLIED